MKSSKKLTSLVLAGALALGVALPAGAGAAQAATIQPLPFTTYVNDSQVTINNSLLYGGHTYVQLRELANVTNMGIDYVGPNDSPTAGPGGGLPNGISIDQPTFVYVKDNVEDWSNVTDMTVVDKAADITTLWGRYQENEGNYKYFFSGRTNSLNVPDGNGGIKKISLHIIQSRGKTYVSVDEFRDKVQPYLIDMCMQ